MTFRTLLKKGYTRKKAKELAVKRGQKPKIQKDINVSAKDTSAILQKIGLTKEQIQKLIGATNERD